MISCLNKEIEKRTRLSNKVKERRKAWGDCARRIDQCFAEVEAHWKSLTGDDLYIEKRTNGSTPHGILTPNSNCVSMRSGNRPTGIGQSQKGSGKTEIEKGGCLLFTQISDGKVMVIATPPESEVKSLPFEKLVIHFPLDPDDLNYSKIEHAIRRYFWLQRISGFDNHPAFFDRMLLFGYWMREWRHSNDWKAWLIFWGSVVALVFAGISMLTDIIGLFDAK